MNPDAFIASETVENPLNYGCPMCGGPCRGHDLSAIDQDMRLKACGLVLYEDQLNGHRWVGPAGSPAIRLFPNRVKVTALYMAQPKPGMEIEAVDGEKYILPKDFQGDWFSIKSPKGVALIAV